MDAAFVLLALGIIVGPLVMLFILLPAPPLRKITRDQTECDRKEHYS